MWNMRLTWYISTGIFHFVTTNKGIFLRQNFYYCFIFSRGSDLENIICTNLSKNTDFSSVNICSLYCTNDFIWFQLNCELLSNFFTPSSLDAGSLLAIKMFWYVGVFGTLLDCLEHCVPEVNIWQATFKMHLTIENICVSQSVLQPLSLCQK